MSALAPAGCFTPRDFAVLVPLVFLSTLAAYVVATISKQLYVKYRERCRHRSGWTNRPDVETSLFLDVDDPRPARVTPFLERDASEAMSQLRSPNRKFGQPANDALRHFNSEGGPDDIRSPLTPLVLDLSSPSRSSCDHAMSCQTRQSVPPPYSPSALCTTTSVSRVDCSSASYEMTELVATTPMSPSQPRQTPSEGEGSSDWARDCILHPPAAFHDPLLRPLR
ncbi:uncharacterized protein C8Q71DRAFT_858059 [Rhodofomes roseus]|uniref:Transmembrane protein n=1 Tax=Rhodofomes roseus TaxID=34475 RepID=A0ABQ8KFH2_9APHY|nr:uncharacterized protein C8Q71DRAFT_858059 [Rhodofomes roseus]KAH9836041.1 hypothetical protein C8Q71DRAFT_858059 [Rhodofomes roseus]